MSDLPQGCMWSMHEHHQRKRLGEIVGKCTDGACVCVSIWFETMCAGVFCGPPYVGR